jgi:hypothetical protein
MILRLPVPLSVPMTMSAPAPAGLAALGLEARGLQAAFDHVGHLQQAIDVEAARFDLHHLLEVVDDRGLRLLCGGEQLGIGRGLHGDATASARPEASAMERRAKKDEERMVMMVPVWLK